MSLSKTKNHFEPNMPYTNALFPWFDHIWSLITSNLLNDTKKWGQILGVTSKTESPCIKTYKLTPNMPYTLHFLDLTSVGGQNGGQWPPMKSNPAFYIKNWISMHKNVYIDTQPALYSKFPRFDLIWRSKWRPVTSNEVKSWGWHQKLHLHAK